MSLLTTELVTLPVTVVKWRLINQCGWNREDRKSSSVTGISLTFSISALIRKGNVGQKACKNLSSVGMKLYVKSEGDACRNVSMMP